ncbi:hypothetical protein BC833DRAFT_453138 [Globomyces pollinis-pini]|nr:hypothetical protein BC833DRAFT_453138 [Globomyces pollinis-pini]
MSINARNHWTPYPTTPNKRVREFNKRFKFDDRFDRMNSIVETLLLEAKHALEVNQSISLDDNLPTIEESKLEFITQKTYLQSDTVKSDPTYTLEKSTIQPDGISSRPTFIVDHDNYDQQINIIENSLLVYYFHILLAYLEKVVAILGICVLSFWILVITLIKRNK